MMIDNANDSLKKQKGLVKSRAGTSIDSCSREEALMAKANSRKRTSLVRSVLQKHPDTGADETLQLTGDKGNGEVRESKKRSHGINSSLKVLNI